MDTTGRILFGSVSALLLLLGNRPLLAEDTHNIQPTTISGPDVSFGAGAASVAVHGMKKGQADGPNDAKPIKQLNNSSKGRPGGGGGGSTTDPVAQSQPSAGAATVTVNPTFGGLGNGFPPFSVDAAPPDTNGAAGATE